MTEELTTLVCLFHHENLAHAALDDLRKAGIPQSSISLVDQQQTNNEGYAGKSLNELDIPDRDRQHLAEGVQAGGVIIAVSEIEEHVGTVEQIFGKHQAGKIDEAVKTERPAPPVAAAAAGTVIPVVEEELAVGKRAVSRGGVRVYRRVVETPVEQTVNLREEHITVARMPVNRAVTEQDAALQGERTIELTETAEQAVVSKSARVVEEVHVGKEVTEHTERIHDSVRHTEVEVEQVAADATGTTVPPASSSELTESDRGVTRNAR